MSADNTQQQSKYPPNRIAGLVHFKPGQSGNPGGLPRGTPKVSVAYQKLLALSSEELANFKPANVAEAIAYRQIGAAIYGPQPLPSTIEITDRTEGKAQQRIEHVDVSEAERLLIRVQERFLAQTGVELSREEAIERLCAIKPELAGQLR
jgi:hypothetical protein